MTRRTMFMLILAALAASPAPVRLDALRESQSVQGALCLLDSGRNGGLDAA